MKYAKWIGGGLGWAFGGPIGALIGFALGSLFDSDDRPAGQRRQTAAGDFKMSLLVLIACIIKADGTVKASELETVRRILVANFGRQEADEAMRILDRLLSQNINETQVAGQIDRNMNYSSKLELLHILFQIAYADGEVNPQELAVLQRIAGIFGISRIDFDAIRAPYTKRNDSSWAYKALGIEPSATDDEIKSAYKEKFRAVKDAYDHLKKERGIK